MRKDHQKLLRVAQSQGFDVTLRRGGHYQIRSPRGGLYHTACTPSDPRSTANLRAWLRRHGLKEAS